MKREGLESLRKDEFRSLLPIADLIPKEEKREGAQKAKTKTKTIQKRLVNIRLTGSRFLFGERDILEVKVGNVV